MGYLEEYYYIFEVSSHSYFILLEVRSLSHLADFNYSIFLFSVGFIIMCSSVVLFMFILVIFVMIFKSISWCLSQILENSQKSTLYIWLLSDFLSSLSKILIILLFKPFHFYYMLLILYFPFFWIVVHRIFCWSVFFFLISIFTVSNLTTILFVVFIIFSLYIDYIFIYLFIFALSVICQYLHLVFFFNL